MDEANDIKIYHLAPAQGRVLFARSLALQLALTAGARRGDGLVTTRAAVGSVARRPGCRW